MKLPPVAKIIKELSFVTGICDKKVCDIDTSGQD